MVDDFVITDPPGVELQRQLVLLSKVLQNLANGVRFGKKEDFMIKLNHFIDENITPLYNFYDTISVRTPFFIVCFLLFWISAHQNLGNEICRAWLWM